MRKNFFRGRIKLVWCPEVSAQLIVSAPGKGYSDKQVFMQITKQKVNGRFDHFVSFMKLFFLCVILALGGCATMNKPLTFKKHSLATTCYSASNMKVKYGQFVTNHCSNKLARAKIPQDDTRVPGAIGAFPAFFGPLFVQWQAFDGTVLSETLNLDEIFKGKVVLHNEDPKQLEPTLPLIMDPTIVVEVNDRTLTIYMNTYMGLITDEPGKLRRGSSNRVMAYQKTFK